jgi:sulfur-carrier protein
MAGRGSRSTRRQHRPTMLLTNAAGTRSGLGIVAAASIIPPMVKVELTRHLYRFFPHLEGRSIEVPAASAAQVVAELEKIAPGIAFYVCDERGSLRPHVNMFVDNELIADRRALTDALRPGSRVHILQALSGG